jgi:arylsulfatase A-like enzyme
MPTDTQMVSQGFKFSHNMEWVASKAEAFIDQSVAEDKPFFLYYNPTTPHAPSADVALNSYLLTETPSGTVASPITASMPSRSNVQTRAEASTKPIATAIGVIQIDDALGSLFAKLEAHNILDDTVIIFTMDHGVAGKGSLYETGTRIAFVAKYANGKDFVPNSKVDILVQNIDIAPTFIELATGETPNSIEREIDGTSLLKILKDPTNAEFKKRAIFTAISKDRAVVTETHKYIWKQIESSGSGIGCGTEGDPGTIARTDHAQNYDDLVQLYDLANDSGEQSNLAGSGDPKETQLKALIDCHLYQTSVFGRAVFGAPCDGVEEFVDRGETNSIDASGDAGHVSLRIRDVVFVSVIAATCAKFLF